MRIRVERMRGPMPHLRSKAATPLRAGRLGAWPTLLLLLLAFVGLAEGCGTPMPEPAAPPQAQLVLLSPQSPLGLSYGEQTTLQFRYLLLGEPQAGVTLKLRLDSTTGGGTLSTPTAVTNDLGEATVRLTAGTTESAFHITVSAPQTTDLLVDVAVSRFAFGTLRVLLDASPVSLAAVQLRAGLYPNASCSELSATPVLSGALRSQRQNGPRGELLFGTLLIQPYAVVGRGEDASGKLLGFGCVEVPERLLRADLNIPVEIPLLPVSPSPVGTYRVDLSLAPKWAVGQPWLALTCSRGLGLVLVDELLTALGPSDLAMRLLAARGGLDARGCRMDSASGSDPDRIVDGLLQATTTGPTLTDVATEFAPALQKQTAKSLLTIRGSASLGFVGEHLLSSIELKTQAMTQTYMLATAPRPSASELTVTQRGPQLSVQGHDLTIRLPRLWQRALSDLVLAPKGVTMTPGQLFQSAVAASRYGTQSGCQALEAALCDQYASPCKGLLLPACQTAMMSAAAQLQSVISDPPLAPDLRLGLVFQMQDPEGTLLAQSLASGVISGEATLSVSTVKVSGTAIGMREPQP